MWKLLEWQLCSFILNLNCWNIYIKGIQSPNRNWPVIFPEIWYFGIFCTSSAMQRRNLQFWCQRFLQVLSWYIFIVRSFCYSDPREPDNAPLLLVCLPDCFCATNRLDLNRRAKRGYSWSQLIMNKCLLIVGSKSY